VLKTYHIHFWLQYCSEASLSPSLEVEIQKDRVEFQVFVQSPAAAFGTPGFWVNP